MIPGGIFVLLFWGTIIALVVCGINKLRERGGSSMGFTEKHIALDIAKERYAKDEISQACRWEIACPA
jgi:uncharacterized membrane protein